MLFADDNYVEEDPRDVLRDAAQTIAACVDTPTAHTYPVNLILNQLEFGSQRIVHQVQIPFINATSIVSLLL